MSKSFQKLLDDPSGENLTLKIVGAGEKVGVNAFDGFIKYPADFDGWNRNTISYAGDQAGTLDFGGFLAHEIGHTQWSIIPGMPARIGEEVHVSSVYENAYRKMYNLPLRDTYMAVDPYEGLIGKGNNICTIEGRC